MKTLLLTGLFGLCSVFTPTNSQEAQSILGRMHDTLEQVAEHSYRLQLKERKMDKSYHEGQMLIRVKNEPLQIWAEILGPDKGPLVEYNAKEDLTAATIIPKKCLPAIKIKGDIHGDLLRRGHYAINETSLMYFDEIISRTEGYFHQKGKYESSVRYLGRIALQGRTCHKIEIIDREYHIKNYRVLKGENLIDISKKLLIPAFKIRELNPGIESYYEVGEGESIKVPSSYGKRCVIYIGSQQYLPRRLEVFDDKGVFEQYSFHDIEIRDKKQELINKKQETRNKR